MQAVCHKYLREFNFVDLRFFLFSRKQFLQFCKTGFSSWMLIIVTIRKLHSIGIIKHVILQLTTGNGQVKQSENVKHGGQYHYIAITFSLVWLIALAMAQQKNTVCTT